MSHYIDSEYVYYQDTGITQLVGAVTKVETERVNDTTLVDITYQFDAEQGRYVEIALGEPYPDPNAPDPKAVKLGELNTACNTDILSGFTSNALGADNVYDFDTDDQINLGGMLNAITAGFVTDSVMWKASGYPQAHTIDQFKLVFVHGMQHKNSKIGKYWTLKGQVLAATTQEEINAINW